MRPQLLWSKGGVLVGKAAPTATVDDLNVPRLTLLFLLFTILPNLISLPLELICREEFFVCNSNSISILD